MYFIVLFSFVLLINNSFSYIIDPGPVVKASIGEVWPKPKHQVTADNYFVIDPKHFDFVVVDNNCDILEKAILRYKEIVSNSINSSIHYDYSNNDRIEDQTIQFVDKILVNLTSPCEHKPYLKMDEWYYLASNGRIIAHSIWGVLRALETFSQLVTPFKNGMLRIPNTRIRDEPRFTHRGLLLDTSRHFIKMENIYKIIDGMEYNKLNVFHWHIVDDHSFPYQSIKFPEISAKGAYSQDMVYTQEDIANVIEYSRLRGIRVLAEFDVPGHTRSWGVSHPELLTTCEDEYEGKLGPVNPIKESSYTFLDEFFREIVDVFPDQYIHVGGDEVGFECWQSNKEINKYMSKANISSYTELQRDFMERVTRTITSKQNTPIVWQEAMVENVNMPAGTVVQVWTGNWRILLMKFTLAGHRVLMSECWYLDHLVTGGDWLKYYQCEPHDFIGTDDQKRLVIGGEACMWSEVVNDNNVLSRIFPRVSATAERLWSTRETTNTANAKRRLEEHTCRMISRGIPAQPPNGPGVC